MCNSGAVARSGVMPCQVPGSLSQHFCCRCPLLQVERLQAESSEQVNDMEQELTRLKSQMQVGGRLQGQVYPSNSVVIYIS